MSMTKVKLRVGTKRRELTTVTTMVITIVQYRRPIVASYEDRTVVSSNLDYGTNHVTILESATGWSKSGWEGTAAYTDRKVVFYPAKFGRIEDAGKIMPFMQHIFAVNTSFFNVY